ncbi:hypothetical protein KA001_03180 [Patescibacteria group bacterium]|nr:hypothetical protein [Patescibacteria group bacterium]
MKSFKKAFLHTSFAFIAFSLFVLPIYLNWTKNLASEILQEVKKIPNNYSLIYEKTRGFSATGTHPVKLKFQNEKKNFVIDPYSKFNEMQKNKEYFILRKKGILFYNGHSLVSNSPIDFSDNFEISQIQTLEFAKSFVAFVQTPYYAILLLLGVYVQTVLDFSLVALFYTLIVFIIFKAQKNKTSYKDILLKTTYLSKFFVIGKGVDVILGLNVFATLLLVVGIGVRVYYKKST